jgi:predicted ATP-dependent endonuclease of OLD family
VHQLQIKNFGPIKDCIIDIDNFTVLTGPQASGKSTVARLVYFFRTVKDELINAAKQGNQLFGKRRDKTWMEDFTTDVLKPKFINIFGSTYSMSHYMTLVYNYSEALSLEIILASGKDDKRQLHITFNPELLNEMIELIKLIPDEMSERELALFKQKVERLFHDPFESIFIPAGRSLLTVLSDQLNYLFLDMNNAQLRTIDFCTRDFISRILKIRTFFSPSNFENLLFFKQQSPKEVDLLKGESQKLLRGEYKYSGNEERLYLTDSQNGSDTYVKINLSSSGQQEMLWLLNLMQYLLYEKKPVFIIIEEPEAHLYPDAQALIADIIGIFAGKSSTMKNSAMVTTHSPYILGELNNLLMCTKAEEEKAKKLKHPYMWLNPDSFKAFHVFNGAVQSALAEDGTVRNELIDEASMAINNVCNQLIDMLYGEGNEDND